MSVSNINHDVNTTNDNGLRLTGLDGANPLGFLAALGLLLVLGESRGFEGLEMTWTQAGGTWVPELHSRGGPSLDESSLLTILEKRLQSDVNDHPAKLLDDFKDASDDRRRRILEEVVSGSDRSRMDWAAAIASDFASSNSINQLQTTRRDYFYGNLTSVMSRTTREHLRRSLFHPWDYADALDNQSLHLDPSEDRRHAHQWNKPAGDPDRKSQGGMLGANRLALEAIPLFPSFPEAGTLRTVGFTGTRSTNTRWTWPIWGPKISLELVRSLLSLEILQTEKLEPKHRAMLRAQGVVAAYRSRRILVEKTPNFTPAQRVA